jgi:hypothetical protein
VPNVSYYLSKVTEESHGNLVSGAILRLHLKDKKVCFKLRCTIFGPEWSI